MDSKSRKPPDSGKIQITTRVSEANSNLTSRPSIVEKSRYQTSHMYAGSNNRTFHSKASSGSKKKSGCCSGCLAPFLAIFIFLCLLASCVGEPEPDPVPTTDDAAITQERAPGTEAVSGDVPSSYGEEIPESDSTVSEPAFVAPSVTPDETTAETKTDPDVTSGVSQPPSSMPVAEDPLSRDLAPEVAPAPDPLAGGSSDSPEPEPTMESDAAAPPVTDIPAGTSSTIVYITDTGAKYHYGDCRHLSESRIETTLDAAVAAGYTPCGICYQ